MYKILILSHMYPNSINPTYGIFVHEQVRELIKQRYKVRVISPVPWAPIPVRWIKKKWHQYAQVPQKEIKEGCEVYHPRYLSFPNSHFVEMSGFFYYWGIKNLVNKIYQDFKFELIHAHAVLPDGYGALLLKKQYKCPIVVTVHGVDIYSTINKNEKCRRSILNVLKKADKIIVVSSVLKKLVGKYLNRQDIFVINNGIDLDRIFRRRSEMKANFGGKKILLSVGSLIERKGHIFVLKAMARIIGEVPNIVYLVVGDGPEQKKLKEEAHKLNLSDKVVFLGNICCEKVMEYMSICNIFVLPSWDESFGVVYIEAMAHGKPVIGCYGEGIEDIVTDGDSGILADPKDLKSLEKVILRLLTDEKFAIQIGKKGQEVVARDFVLSNKAKEIIRLYKRLFPKSPARLTMDQAIIRGSGGNNMLL